MFILNCNIKQSLLFKVIFVNFWSELPLITKVILYGFRVLLRYPDKFLTESLRAHSGIGVYLPLDFMWLRYAPPPQLVRTLYFQLD